MRQIRRRSQLPDREVHPVIPLTVFASVFQSPSSGGAMRLRVLHLPERAERSGDHGTIGKAVNKTGHKLVDGTKCCCIRFFKPACRDGWNVEQQIGLHQPRRASASHCNRIGRQDITKCFFTLNHGSQSAESLRVCQWVVRWCQCCMWNSHSHRLRHHLTGRGGSEELATTTGCSASPTAFQRGFFK